DDPTFGALVRRMRETTVEAMEHADIPFEVLVRHLTGGRNPSRPPLVQVLFNVVQATERPPEGIGASRTPFSLDRDATPFEVSAAIFLDERSAHLNFTWATSLFDASTIESMAGHFLG